MLGYMADRASTACTQPGQLCHSADKGWTSCSTIFLSLQGGTTAAQGSIALQTAWFMADREACC